MLVGISFVSVITATVAAWFLPQTGRPPKTRTRTSRAPQPPRDHDIARLQEAGVPMHVNAVPVAATESTRAECSRR